MAFPAWRGQCLQPSGSAPDDIVVRAFAGSDVLRFQQRRAFTRMMQFYGFDVEEDINGAVADAVYLDQADNFDQRSRLWGTPGNHNYRRITRILKSMTLLSSPKHAQGLNNVLQALYLDFGARIGRQALAFWNSAANGHGGRP